MITFTPMQYCQNPEADYPILALCDHIGYDQEQGTGIIGKDFANEILQLERMGKKSCCVWINSPGGSVVDGYDIVTAMLKSDIKVDTLCSGMAASMAAVIFQAGRKRTMMDYGFLMYHNPYSEDGGADDMIDKMKGSLNTIISQKSGMSPEDVQKMMDKETYLDAVSARNLGLCDDIEETDSLNKKRLSGVSGSTQAYWKAAKAVMNQQLNEKINFHMENVTSLLGLSAQASAGSIENAIRSIMNKSESKIKKMEDDMEELQNKIKELTDKHEKIKAAHEEACKDRDEAKKEAKDLKEEKAKAEEEDKKAKAETMVENAIKARKIKAEAKPKFIALAMADYDTAKDIIDSIATTVNAKAPVLELHNQTASGVKNFASVAEQVAAKKLANKGK